MVSINRAVFDNGKKNEARNSDAMKFKPLKNSLVYIDPPYFTPKSDAEYVRRYHFVEGLARDWQGVEIQEHTLTKKFKGYPMGELLCRLIVTLRKNKKRYLKAGF